MNTLANLDPSILRAPMTDPKEQGDGTFVQEQIYKPEEVMPDAMFSKLTEADIIEVITKKPDFAQIIHWGNLSRSGIQLSDQFIIDHAEQLDWNLLSLFAPLSAKVAKRFTERINPHMLMKNPNLKGELLAATVDRLDMERVVKELKLGDEFVERNLEVLDMNSILKHQELSGTFWIKYLRHRASQPQGLVGLAGLVAQIVEQQKKLDMTFVNGLGDLQKELNEHLARGQIPNPGVALPYKLVDGAMMISHVKFDLAFINGLLSHQPPEKLPEIKRQLATYQKLDEATILRHYQNDLPNPQILGALLLFQDMPQPFLEAVWPQVLTNQAYRGAALKRQKLSNPQIWGLIQAVEPHQQNSVVSALMVRTLYNPEEEYYLPMEPETLARLASHVKWTMAIPDTGLSASQVRNALLRLPGHLDWRNFIPRYHQFLTEELIEEAHASGCLGPLEWVMLLVQETTVTVGPNTQRKWIRNKKYTEAFLTRHASRFSWWKYVNPTQLPFSMLNPKVPTEARDYVLAQADAIIRVYVQAEDWVHTLREVELPLWFLDGLGRYKHHIDMFGWKLSCYQKLSLAYIRDHIADLDMRMLVKNQLVRLYIHEGPASVEAFLKEYIDFFDDESIEFVKKNATLCPLYEKVREANNTWIPAVQTPAPTPALNPTAPSFVSRVLSAATPSFIPKALSALGSAAGYQRLPTEPQAPVQAQAPVQVPVQAPVQVPQTPPTQPVQVEQVMSVAPAPQSAEHTMSEAPLPAAPVPEWQAITSSVPMPRTLSSGDVQMTVPSAHQI